MATKYVKEARRLQGSSDPEERRAGREMEMIDELRRIRASVGLLAFLAVAGLLIGLLAAAAAA